MADFLYKEVRVYAHGSDLVTIPLFKSQSQGDLGWCIPIKVFHQKALGDGVVLWNKFYTDVCSLCGRLATPEELEMLKTKHFIGETTTKASMISLRKLVKHLEGAINTCHQLTSTLKSLVNEVMGSQATTIFPDHIPPCPISGEALNMPYSLKANFPEYFSPGSLFHSQLEALKAYKANPPFSRHGHVKKVGPTTIIILENSLDQFMGFAKLHLGLEPSMDLVCQPDVFSKYLAFHGAKDNSPSTKFRATHQISSVVPFVASKHCPQAQAWDAGHVAQCNQWYSNLKADLRLEVDSLPAKRSLVPLAQQWEVAEDDWEDFLEAFKVSSCCLMWHGTKACC